ncbi:MAG: flagellar biosynthesis anti-sigma factor FlgM [Firmicutes bacterium]|nr:flagellar biosynthesis anti-sigma factor FlgM [Bacillota bacterium]
MIGPSNGINQILRIYRQEKVEGSKPAAKTSTGKEKDELVISDEARVVTVAQQAVKDASDIRTDKVAAIKEAIEKGTYQVPSDQVAEAILNFLSGDKF